MPLKPPPAAASAAAEVTAAVEQRQQWQQQKQQQQPQPQQQQQQQQNSFSLFHFLASESRNISGNMCPCCLCLAGRLVWLGFCCLLLACSAGLAPWAGGRVAGLRLAGLATGPAMGLAWLAALRVFALSWTYANCF